MSEAQPEIEEAAKSRKRPAPESPKSAKKPRTISDQLRAILRGLQVSPYEIAVKAGVDHKVIARFLKGEADPANPDGPRKVRGLTLATVDRIGAKYGLKIRQDDDSKLPEDGDSEGDNKSKPKAKAK